ncbi:hypothetical protein [Halosolutus halophilus]|uniref:hypothetical protein n=1 Tax=Halosolutus halophilus TaxID=1552990 RepID=UPI0022352CE5|nr:hypothetical protein [Halosolutus halophilus]
MVSPHDSWKDVEDGYRRGRVGVFVEPISVQGRDGPTPPETDTDEPAATAYAVTMRRPMDSVFETETTLVSFEDVRTAWEYANLVTHYVAESADPNFAESQLQGRVGPPAERWTPDGPVSDLTAADVMRRQVAHHASKIEHLVGRKPTAAG